MQMEKSELSPMVKHLHKKGLPSKEILMDMVTMLGNGAPSYPVVRNWAAEFKCGRMGTENIHILGRRVEVAIPDNVGQVQ